jgi:hypothetical protein
MHGGAGVSTLTASTPVTEAVFAVLQDATLQTAIGGRLYDDLPQDVARPCVLIHVFNESTVRNMGTTGLRELEVRTHVFSDLGSLSEAKAIDAQIVALLDLAVPTVTGFNMCGTVWTHESLSIGDSELSGVKVHERVSIHTLTVEAS